MRLIYLCLLLSIPVFLQAQPGWVKGYIVTNSLDTLYGKIYYSTPAQRSVKILFKEDGYDDKIKYRPFTIKGFFVKDQYFVSRIYDIHPSLSYGLGVFMEVKNEGESPVKVLEYWNTDKIMGFTQTFLVKSGGKSYEINPLRFKKTVASFFSDYKDLQEDILNGKYKRKDLLSIVKRYNTWRNKKKNK